MSTALFEKPVEPDSLRQYLSEIHRYPPIDREEEVELARRRRLGEQLAFEKLVKSNLRAVVFVARRYQTAGVPFADLINSGNRGLVHAAKQFDETEGVRFMSFAVWRIREAIVDTISNPEASESALPDRENGGCAETCQLPEPLTERPDGLNGASTLPGAAATATANGYIEDDALMEGVGAGCNASLQALLNRYWAPLVSYAGRITNREDEADDVVQETFVQVWKQRLKWTSSGSVSAYLYRITRNLALNARRDRKARQSRDERGGSEAVGVCSGSDPAAALELEALQKEVESAIASLSRRRREVLILSRFHGLTHQEIAEKLGLSRQTVANHMMAALTELRRSLSSHLQEG